VKNRNLAPVSLTEVADTGVFPEDFPEELLDAVSESFGDEFQELRRYEPSGGWFPVRKE
jgi:hypothetical protein